MGKIIDSGSIDSGRGLHGYFWQSILLDRTIYGSACRSALALLGAICCGLLSASMDIGHVLSLVSPDCTWDVEAHSYGCRWWHDSLLPVGIGFGKFAITLGIGLFIILVGYAAWRSFRIRYVKSRKVDYD